MPPDKDHNYSFAVDSHPAVLDGFMDEFRQAYQALGLFDHKHCIQEDGGVDYAETGKFIMISYVHPEARVSDNILHYPLVEAVHEIIGKRGH